MKKSEFTRKEQKAMIYQRDKEKRLAYQTEYRAKEKAKQDALLAIAMAALECVDSNMVEMAKKWQQDQIG
jgi:hypothetical protein